MAEMYGKQEGCSRGRGGSMHLFDAETRFYGGNAIVGGGLPLAVGLALADKHAAAAERHRLLLRRRRGRRGRVPREPQSGRAVAAAGAVRLREQSLRDGDRPRAIRNPRPTSTARRESYRVPAEVVDGMDVVAVEAATRRVVAAIRGGGGPRFLECRTYRFRAHSMFDPQLYRDKAEVEDWKKRDPIARLIGWMRETGALHDTDLARSKRKCGARSRRRSPLPSRALGAGRRSGQATSTPGSQSADDRNEGSSRSPIAMRCGPAIREALLADDRVFLMGEDVGRYGGCYAVTKGLLDEFGPERIRDTPLSEGAFVGAGIGAALGGMRPIVEVMTVNFSLLALDQIVNNAATIRHMSGGQFAVPVVIRMATGAGRQLAAQHSHRLEGWYAHIPGLKVVTPATLEDARFMLAAALADPNPVLIFEHVML